MPKLSSSQIDRLAERTIISYCHDEICNHISHQVKEALAEQEQQHPNKEFFDVLFKALESHEKRFAAVLIEIWKGQERIILANIKKLKKAYLGKQHEETIESLLYPRKEAEKKMAEAAKKLYNIIMLAEAQRVIGVYDLGIAFDLANPLVVAWLKSYIPVFSKNLEAVSVEKLRRELIAGLDAGEGIPKLTKRVNETYANWYKYRSETIARSEVIRASNRAALESYRQSGVIKKKEWLCSPGVCEFCEPLCGQIVGLEETYFDKGDTHTIEVDGKERTMKLDYEDVETPPLHPRCRCAIIPVIEG